jgi:hypothetical protein
MNKLRVGLICMVITLMLSIGVIWTHSVPLFQTACIFAFVGITLVLGHMFRWMSIHADDDGL